MIHLWLRKGRHSMLSHHRIASACHEHTIIVWSLVFEVLFETRRSYIIWQSYRHRILCSVQCESSLIKHKWNNDNNSYTSCCMHNKWQRERGMWGGGILQWKIWLGKVGSLLLTTGHDTALKDFIRCKTFFILRKQVLLSCCTVWLVRFLDVWNDLCCATSWKSDVLQPTNFKIPDHNNQCK